MSVSISPRRSGAAGPAVHGLLRIAAAGNASAIVSAVTGVTGRLGIGLDRLNGQHGPALYATAPTGAGLR